MKKENPSWMPLRTSWVHTITIIQNTQVVRQKMKYRVMSRSQGFGRSKQSNKSMLNSTSVKYIFRPWSTSEFYMCVQ